MQCTQIDRRKFLKQGMAGFALLAAGTGLYPGRRSTAAAISDSMSNLQHLGPLGPADENGIMLTSGFRSRVVARSGEIAVSGSDYVWHDAPDGGATYATHDGGWIYVCNAELRSRRGGVGALRFNSTGVVTDSYPILMGTENNCAGGKTPWQTWLSCEEVDNGQVYECDPFGKREAVVRPALGTFKHEAVAVDPVNQHIYLTEDQRDGALYRFKPEGLFPDITSGYLEIATLEIIQGKSILKWTQVPDPGAGQTPTRYQVANYASFDGGEGIIYQQGRIYFSTKGDNRVWLYNIANSEISVIYDIASSSNPILSGVDNLMITPAGDVLVAEDGGDMQLVVLTADEQVIPLLQIVGQDRSEITGPAFDPSYTRLYFNSQRGPAGASSNGITYEISVQF